jgi:hypothetical protein
MSGTGSDPLPSLGSTKTVDVETRVSAMVDTLCLVAYQLVKAGIVGPNSFKLQEPHPADDYFPTHEHLVSELHVVLQVLDMRALHGKCPLSAKATETLQAAQRSVRREPDSMAEEDAADHLAKLAAKVVRSLVSDVQCGFKYLVRSYGWENSAAFQAFYDAAVTKLAACVSEALSARTQAGALTSDMVGRPDDASDATGAPCVVASALCSAGQVSADDGPAGGGASAAVQETVADGSQHICVEDSGGQTAAEGGGAAAEDCAQRKRGRMQ